MIKLTETIGVHMRDINWVITVKIKTDSSSGQPSKQDMQELLTAMLAQVEMLSDDYGYEYVIEEGKVDSDE